ncbi:MAG: DUF2953 domain-containing protein [Oscillospiraceae bacterium]|nr:DUF2953 domain-containing protein [Oscillospiraceae bacterium]
MMGWLIAFVVIFLLAILPLGAMVKYNADGVLVKIIAGPVRFTVFPMKKEKKDKKPKQEKKSKKEEKPKETADEKTSQEKKEKGGSLLDFLPLVQVALDLLGDFRRKLRLNRLELKLIMAGDDPCDLAVNYGRAWAAVGNLIPLLDRAFVIKKRDIEVECDFTATKTLIIARLDITITLGRIIALAVVYGIRALREYLKIMNTRKGGAVK